MAVSRQSCSYCGHIQFVGEDVESFRCQLCGRICHISAKKLGDDLTAVGIAPRDFEIEITAHKESCMKLRKAAIDEFYASGNIWDGIESADLYSRTDLDHLASKVYIKAIDLQANDLTIVLDPTYIVIHTSVKPKGPLGLFGKEVVEHEDVEHYKSAQELMHMVDCDVRRGSNNTIRADAEFLEDSNRVVMLGKDIKESNFVIANTLFDSNEYLVHPIGVKVNLRFDPNWSVNDDPNRYSWPRLERLRAELRNDIDKLKKSPLVDYIKTCMSSYDRDDTLLPRDQRKGMFLSPSHFGSLDGLRKLKYTDILQDEYRNYKFDDLNDSQLVALALAVEESTEYFIPISDDPYLASYRLIRRNMLIDEGNYECIILENASYPFPERKYSIYNAMIDESELS